MNWRNCCNARTAPRQKIIFLVMILGMLNLNAENEINLPEFANLIGFPGMPLETIDYTARESKVRNIHFKRVLYVKVADRDYIYPAVVYIAPKGSIDSDKYDTLREMVRSFKPEDASKRMKNGFFNLPDLDNAVVYLDSIRMTSLIDFPDSDREEWFDTDMGGYSITCSSDELGFDYQIFLTGQEERDPDLVSTYKVDRADVAPELAREIVENLIRVVRESPMMAAEVSKEQDKKLKQRFTVDQCRDRSLMETAVADKGMSDTKHTFSDQSIRPWLIGLAILSIAVLIYRFRRRIIQ